MNPKRMRRFRRVASSGYMPMSQGVDLSRRVDRLPFMSLNGASIDARFAPNFRGPDLGLGDTVDSRFSPHFLGGADPSNAPVVVVAQEPKWRAALTVTSSVLGLYVFYHFIIKPNLR